jgi:O-antigen ligase
VFFLATIFSGFLERVPGLHTFHPLTVVGGLTLIAVASSGRLPSIVVHNRIGRSLLLFTAWFIACIPFARWRGGSFGVFVNIWSRSALAFVLVAGCILTIKQCKGAFKTIGYSVGVLSIVALALRDVDKTGRLGFRGTRYENANDFAWTLIMGLSFLSFLIIRGDRTEKIIALSLSAPILVAIVKTGSRDGMIGLLMLAIFSFLQASRAVRIKLAAGFPVLLILLLALAPADLRARYTTLFTTGQNATKLEKTAVGSAEARLQTLKDSIYLTLTNPVFGVGPGNFPTAQNDLAVSRGDARGLWLATHNTYTQVSSEMGIPGLIIYLVFLYQCFKPLNSILRTKYSGRDWQDLRALTKSLRASFVIVLTVAIFDAYGYDFNIPVLAGMSCALGFIAQRQRALSNEATPTTGVPESVPDPVSLVYS